MAKSLYCPKCGSGRVLDGLRILDTGKHSMRSLTIELPLDSDALIFTNSVYSKLVARVCGDCGFTELYAPKHKELWDAQFRVKG